MKKYILYLLTIYLFIPISVFAYSDYLIASGQNIGIELKSDYVLIVGSYKIDNYNVLTETNLRIGDKITKINNQIITSIVEMQEIIDFICCWYEDKYTKRDFIVPEKSDIIISDFAIDGRLSRSKSHTKRS